MKKLMAVVSTLVLSASTAGAADLASLQKTLDADRGSGSSFNALYDGGARSGAAPAPVAGGETAGAGPLSSAAPTGGERFAEPPAPARDYPAPSREEGVWEGVKNGAAQGALGGFFAVISPAAALMSEGFGRRMSRAYDGAGSDNGGGTAYEVAGAALGVLLYAPALAVGAVTGLVGAASGAVSEAVAPGSTSAWDAEKWLFGSRG